MEYFVNTSQTTIQTVTKKIRLSSLPVFCFILIWQKHLFISNQKLEYLLIKKGKFLPHLIDF